MTDTPNDSSTETHAKRRAFRISAFIIAAVAVLVLAKAGYGRWSYGHAHVTTDDAQVDGRIVPVVAKVGGYVQRIGAIENQPIARGDSLVQIDKTEYLQRLAQASAEERAAAATAGAAGIVGVSQAQVASASSQRAALDAQIASANATLQNATADLERVETLAARQIVSRAQLDNARAAVETARAAVEALQRQAAASDAQVTSAQAGVRVAQARLDAARAARSAAELSLSYTTVLAPESGIVSRKQVEVGQLVQPGQPLMAVVADSGNWITANFKETQLADIHAGQAVDVRVDAYDTCKATGRVLSVGAATGAKFALLPPDNATGNFTKVVQRIPVRIAIVEGCGPERPLRPGMSVTASVRTN